MTLSYLEFEDAYCNGGKVTCVNAGLSGTPSNLGAAGLCYSLPMISVTNAITTELEEGRMTWRDFSNDTVHPNVYGHRLTADKIFDIYGIAYTQNES